MAASSRKTQAISAFIIVALGAYLIVAPPHEGMAASLQRFVPRVSLQASYVKSLVPPFQKPFTFTTSPAASISQSNSFTSSTSKMTHDTLTFKDAVQNRRTIYQLTKKSTISNDKIKDIVTTAIKDVPSSFNSQSARLVVLVQDEHDKFWQIVTDILKVHVPEAQWEHTAQRMDMFKGAYGTVHLFIQSPFTHSTC